MKFNIGECIQILSKTPKTLENLLQGLPNAWVASNEGADTWSPFDIVGHLIEGEKTDWIPRARIILSNSEDKKFVPFDRFTQFEESKGKTLNQLLKEFSELRKENITALKSLNLDDEILNKTGIHPEFGSVTMRQLLATWVVHDLSHVNQMTRVMSKLYKDEVGPWSKYISILK